MMSVSLVWYLLCVDFLNFLSLSWRILFISSDLLSQYQFSSEIVIFIDNLKQNTLHCFHYFSKILLFNLSTCFDFRVHKIFSLRSFSSLNTSLKQFELLYFSKRSMNGYKWIILNSFSTNIPVMDNPGSWFLLPKCLKNTCGRVTF